MASSNRKAIINNDVHKVWETVLISIPAKQWLDGKADKFKGIEEEIK